MSACDTCKDPGYCCKRLMLGGVTAEAFPTREEAQLVAKHWPFEPNGLPFIPAAVVEGYWLYTCPKLDWNTGRCTIYETRPGLCKAYEPLSDPLCAMFEEKATP